MERSTGLWFTYLNCKYGVCLCIDIDVSVCVRVQGITIANIDEENFGQRKHLSDSGFSLKKFIAWQKDKVELRKCKTVLVSVAPSV